MRTTARLLHAAIVAALAVGGQAYGQADPKKPEVKKDAPAKAPAVPRGRGENAVYCSKTPCRIKLAVTLDPKGNCTAVVGPEYIAVSSELRSVTIQWQLQTAGWTFVPGTGIRFKGANKAVAVKVFKTNKVRNPEEWEEVDDNTPGTFQYAINLQSGPKKCTRDPIIINDMGPGGP